jgi:hypothetical protein
MRPAGSPELTYSAPMRLIWVARMLGLSGFSAVSAVAAHEGPAALAGGPPLRVALAGAAAAATGACCLLLCAAGRYTRAARVGRGDVAAARLDRAAPLPFPVLAATLVACQGVAHVTLLLHGTAAHGGAPAPIALHVVLALAGAVAMLALERVLLAATGALAWAIAAAAGMLEAVRAPAPAPRARPRRMPAPGGARHGRAPPAAATVGS